MPRIHLRDISPKVVAGWGQAFADLPDVFMSQGNILEQAADAIVSPANSFGFMDGGIDLLYARRFGWQLETELRDLLSVHHYGELPVGQAVVLATGDASIPFLVSAPTMRIPTSIADTVNVYLAFRAALIAVLRHNAAGHPPIESLLVPGMGTGIGALAPELAARQMRAAYDAVLIRKGDGKHRSARMILSEHHDLLA